MSNLEPVLEMEDVSIASATVPPRAMITGVNWRVLPSEYWVIGALPHSGKSDLLATAAGLQKTLAGSHRLFGLEISELREERLVEARLRAGLVFENGARLFQHMTVFENIGLPLRYHGNLSHSETMPRVEEILDWTGLTEWSGVTPATLPRNLRQRVGLARALALAPDLLLLDNPIAGLDPRQINWWLEFLSGLVAGAGQLKGRKMTVVVATDDFRQWAEQGSRFALLKDREWFELGGYESLASSTEPLVRELMAADFTYE